MTTTDEVFDLPLDYWRCEGQYIATLAYWDAMARKLDGDPPPEADLQFMTASLKSPHVLTGIALLPLEGLVRTIVAMRTAGVCLPSDNDILLPEGVDLPELPSPGVLAPNEDVAEEVLQWLGNKRAAKPRYQWDDHGYDYDPTFHFTRLSQRGLSDLQKVRVLATMEFGTWAMGWTDECDICTEVAPARVRDLLPEGGDGWTEALIKPMEEGPVLWKKLEEWRSSNV